MSGQRKFKRPAGAEGKPLTIRRHRATLPTAAELDAASRFELAAALRENTELRRAVHDEYFSFAEISVKLAGMKPGEIRALCDRHAITYKPNGPHNGWTNLAGKQRLLDLDIERHALKQAGIHEVAVPDRGSRRRGRARFEPSGARSEGAEIDGMSRSSTSATVEQHAPART